MSERRKLKNVIRSLEDVIFWHFIAFIEIFFTNLSYFVIKISNFIRAFLFSHLSCVVIEGK